MKYIFLLVCVFALSCNPNPYRDTNDDVPSGDPPFTPLTNSWVIDNEKLLSPDTILQGNAICQNLQDDGVAEVVVLIQTHIKHPEDYATHYGRWLGLGKRGASSSGGNNGIVWLIRPDAKEKLTVSVGRGLPQFTSIDFGRIIDESIDYINFGNYNSGVLNILSQTNQRLREIKKSNKEDK